MPNQFREFNPRERSFAGITDALLVCSWSLVLFLLTFKLFFVMFVEGL